ncbi:MAG: NUDIX protein [Parcubacteria group bacterium Gr01-1014_18]|nr:MAG: NUDIX protein [Parcubacteria group bacterium Greene0416_36]TSC79790.1 MAG: NUDIX protein [Parcubacteria group bacterium Gr01-1014_18]TSC98074.1 MAG: NUDIX protein [Parcubacteria group bacterium Greene1014_20]TSD06509.1 MAG: NUDIX protein [Parcubacteria group bacterium Greene0714_2]
MLIYKSQLEWKGENYLQELHDDEDFSVLEPVKQVSGICFTDADHIVLYKNKGGYYGIPGGGPEAGETFQATLRRELFEEAALEVVRFGPAGYMKVSSESDPEKIQYQLRYWAEVKLLDCPINDPCQASLGREIFHWEEAIKNLWNGKDGDRIVRLAREKYLKYSRKND